MHFLLIEIEDSKEEISMVAIFVCKIGINLCASDRQYYCVLRLQRHRKNKKC